MSRSSFLLLPILAGLSCSFVSTDVAAHRSGVGPLRASMAMEKHHRAADAGRLLLAKRVMDLPPAARDALTLERLYRRQGRVESAVSMYQGLLDRSADPLLRQIAHRRLARIAWRQGDAVAAEKHLRESLDEQLSRQ